MACIYVISKEHNIAQFYVASQYRLIVIHIIAITDFNCLLVIVESLSLGAREMLNLSTFIYQFYL